MQGVGQGTILGGRYALRHRLTQARGVERWSAHDTTLERQVALTIVSSYHPNRAAILDAARRAAGVEDARLVRILDVGTQGGNSFIAEEAMEGSESLAELLLDGALPADEARRIAGETASALEAAGQRGLHHLRLTPHCVLRASDGMIKVIGVAVAGAIDEIEEPDPAAASRRDAVSVVALAYAGLTTRWPLDEEVPYVEPAPRVAGGVAAPSEISAGVPGDLDALCWMTLNEDAGPMTPGEFATQIAPWSREPVQDAVVDPTVVMHLPESGSVDEAPVEAEAPVGVGAESTVVLSTLDLPTDDPSTTSTGAVPQEDGSGSVAASTTGDKAAAAGAAATKAVGTALASAGAAAGKVGGKVGFFARAADKAGVKATHPDADPGSEQALRENVWTQSAAAEPPLPLLPASTAQAQSRAQSRVVILIVATFVALALLVAYCGTRDLGKSFSLPNSTPRRAVAVKAPPVAVPSPPATQKGPAAPVPGRAIGILSAKGFDPEGDQTENKTQAARVYDTDLATAWTSEGYNSAALGGLKKGVGVLLDLGQPTSVSQVTIDLGLGPVDITAYAASDTSLEGAAVIGTASSASGRVQIRATSVLPPAQYLIVWFTKLAPDGGQFRASISEIALN